MKNRIGIILLFHFFLGSVANFCFAQSFLIRADRYKALIGQQITIEISYLYNEDEKVLWADLSSDTIGSFEIISRSTIDTIISQDGTSNKIQQKLIVTSFTPGMQKFPSLQFQVSKKESNDFKTIYSDELLLEINTVQVDTTQQIKDIKDIMSAPLEWEEWLPWIALIALLFLFIGLGIWWYLKRKKALATPSTLAPPVPPYEILIGTLQRAKQQQIWKQGQIKQYYSEIADSLRLYIEDEWNVRALELTSDEILGMLKSNPKFQSSYDNLKQIFKKADLVKFAKYKPSEAEHAEVLELAFKVAELLNNEKQKSNPPLKEGGENV